MQNFRVHNLEKLIADLKNEGVTIVGEMETYSYGKFAWILDPEENKNIAVDDSNKELIQDLSEQLNKGWQAAKPKIE